MTTQELSQSLHQYFIGCFGRTPIRQRLEDILGEAIELSRFTDVSHLQEEFGDLLTSVLVGISECGWNPEVLINNTLEKIERKRRQYQTLGRKTKIAILGGSFNPITVDHINLAKFVLNTSKTFDEVWLMPASKHMEKNLVEFDHRYNMCALAAKDKRIKVSRFEHEAGLCGDTLQLFKMLELSSNGTESYSLIMGQDVANGFPSWSNFTDLERQIQMVVVPRKGVPLNLKNDWFLKPPHIYLANTDDSISDISSTDVRRMISCGLDTSGVLDRDVREYIDQNNLYV